LTFDRDVGKLTCVQKVLAPAGVILLGAHPRAKAEQKFDKGTSAQVIVALGVGAEGALHARTPRRRNSEGRSHAPGCAEVPKMFPDTVAFLGEWNS